MVTERTKLMEQYNSDKTNYSEKPHILRLINKIDTENDRTLEAIRVIFETSLCGEYGKLKEIMKVLGEDVESTI